MLPNDSDFRSLLHFCQTGSPMVLPPEDDAYLRDLVAAIRSGKRAVVIVEETDSRLKYMFSNTSRGQAVSIMGRVLDANGRQIDAGNC